MGRLNEFHLLRRRLPKRMNEREEKEINLFVSFELSGFTSRGGLAEWCVVGLFLCGLWAGPPANAPQRERERPQTHTTPTLSFIDGRNWLKWSEINGIQSTNEASGANKSELNWWNGVWADCLSFLKWNGREENKRGNGMEAEWSPTQGAKSSAASQGSNPANPSIVGGAESPTIDWNCFAGAEGGRWVCELGG